ncbi:MULTISPECIES: hypothetical protein [unclassified Cryobacterium]|uniref:hypothetical protein n=1 Tax=unclassified Cryobacterium TaxID=2649013 RepID=UPI0014479930|nr:MULTISPECIES: hypothetical protein [unclassified Cryobacterium]
MAGGDLRVDYNRLGELETNLTAAVDTVGREFESMLTLSHAVGDHRLAARTVEFRDSWDKRRLEIVKNLEWLRDSVRNIHTQLAETDASLANGLTNPPAGNGPAPQAV